MNHRNELEQFARKQCAESCSVSPLSDNPFATHSRVHDWRNYIPDAIQARWGGLTEMERLLIGVVAQRGADNEDWD